MPGVCVCVCIADYFTLIKIWWQQTITEKYENVKRQLTYNKMFVFTIKYFISFIRLKYCVKLYIFFLEWRRTEIYSVWLLLLLLLILLLLISSGCLAYLLTHIACVCISISTKWLFVACGNVYSYCMNWTKLVCSNFSSMSMSII